MTAKIIIKNLVDFCNDKIHMSIKCIRPVHILFDQWFLIFRAYAPTPKNIFKNKDLRVCRIRLVGLFVFPSVKLFVRLSKKLIETLFLYFSQFSKASCTLHSIKIKNILNTMDCLLTHEYVNKPNGLQLNRLITFLFKQSSLW